MAGTGVFGRGIWGWLLGYVAMVTLVIWSVLSARHWALTELATPASTAEWEAWRDDVRAEQGQPAPIQRRVPKSAEPPALVLTRDYFAVVMCGSVLFTSLVYWVLAWMIAGTLAARNRVTSDRRAS
jgi:hypothetical protein